MITGRGTSLQVGIMTEATTELGDMIWRTNAQLLVGEVEQISAWKAQHCRRVGQLVVRTCEELGMPPEDCAAVALGGYLHEIGSIDSDVVPTLNPSRDLNFTKAVDQRPYLGAQKASDRLLAQNKFDTEAIHDACYVIANLNVPQTEQTQFEYGREYKRAIAATKLTQLADRYDSLMNGRSLGSPISATRAEKQLSGEFEDMRAFAVPAPELLQLIGQVAQERPALL
jgi:hypothetical protein